MSGTDWKDWIGRTRTRSGMIAPGDMAALAGLFDRPESPLTVPPAWHWATLNPAVRQSLIGADGHPLRGDFLPPIAFPRRMFAAAKMRFSGALEIGVEAELVETIANITLKQGATGPLMFVEVGRCLSQGGAVRVDEVQTLAYRQPDQGAPSPPKLIPPPAQAEWRVEVRPDPVLLFRFSAATSNTHRIHYDRPYATDVEGYPALVVHGPLIALSLLEGLATARLTAKVTAFSFRALRPLFDDAAFTVCGAVEGDKALLWAQAPDGGVAMSAEATLEG